MSSVMNSVMPARSARRLVPRQADPGRRWPEQTDQGASTVEVVLLTPLLIMVVLMVVACARVTDAHLRLAHAAAIAARTASLARSVGTATQTATASARQAARGAGLSCQRLTAAIGTRDWRPGGTVRVRLACSVDLADLALLRLPGRYQITASASSPIDRWRAADSGPTTPGGRSWTNSSTGGA